MQLILVIRSNLEGNEMNLFWNFNKSASAATLVKQGLDSGNTTTVNEIKDCVFLVANAMGETWKTLSKEAAAGVVLVVLAKNTMLTNFVNAAGWELVLNLVKTNPVIARDISPKTRAEINAFRPI